MDQQSAIEIIDRNMHAFDTGSQLSTDLYGAIVFMHNDLYKSKPKANCRECAIAATRRVMFWRKRQLKSESNA